MEFNRKRRKMMENSNLEKIGFSYPNSSLTGFSDTILLDLRRRFSYFIKREFSEDKINITKALMCYILENQYPKLKVLITSANIASTKINTISSSMKSRLDEDFDDEEDEVDKINIYINEKPTNKEMDVLVWWKIHQTQYPYLTYMTYNYLTIPLTSITSEHLFS